MNEEAHWDRIAPGYDEEIFDVFRSDKNRLLAKYFKKHGNPTHQAIDFGCGNGKALPYLSQAFGEVLAIDISAALLKTAKGRGFKNARFQQADLTRNNLRIEPVDFLFCCNVIMLPEVEKNRAMFRNVSKVLRKGGNGVLVVPSLESILFASWRLIEWYRKEGVKVEKIPASELRYFAASKRRIVEGIIHIDGVPTKHYSEPELRVILAESGLNVMAIERLEYDWNTEFPEPPNWMKEPFPWDWLIECKQEK